MIYILRLFHVSDSIRNEKQIYILSLFYILIIC